jgi:hypothetical protein
MKKILTFSLAALMNSAVLATPITLQHVTTTYANSGICSAAIDVTLDGFLGEQDKLYLDLIAKDKAGRVQGSSKNEITYDDVQSVSGQSYSKVFIESETMCAADQTWTVEVKRAVLITDGKREDLLQTKQVQIDNFQPMKFKVN